MWKFLLIIFLGNSWALTEQDAKVEFTKHVMRCTKQHPVDLSELTLLQNLKTPTKQETKCLLACAYKKDKTMNEKGLYDLEANYARVQAIKSGDAEKLANAKKLIDTCKKVNDVPVTDGENGCDRAALIFSCKIENAPKFGFKV